MMPGQAPQSDSFQGQYTGERRGVFDRLLETLSHNALYGNFVVPHAKLIIELMPLIIAEAESEFHVHKIYQATVRHMIGYLSPVIANCNDNELIEQFQSIKARASACGVVEVCPKLIQQGPHDRYYEFDTMISILDKDSQEVSVAPINKALKIRVDYFHLDIGKTIARDDAYSRINCGVENVYTDLFELMCKLDMLNFESSIGIDNRQFKPEVIDDESEWYRQRRMAMDAAERREESRGEGPQAVLFL